VQATLPQKKSAFNEFTRILAQLADLDCDTNLLPDFCMINVTT
jgi:hypothetical protein